MAQRCTLCNSCFSLLVKPVSLYILPVLTGVFFLMYSHTARATHYSSGEIFYQWVGNEPGKNRGAYRVFASIYRNTSGITIGTNDLNGCAISSNSASSTINFKFKYISPQNTLNPKYRLTPGNPYGWKDTGPHPNDSEGWNIPDSDICASSSKTISEYRYVGEVDLTGSDKKWTLAINPPCCRDINNNLKNTNGNLFLSAKLDRTFGENSSPRITSFTQYSLCVISDSTRAHRLEFKARDSDGDSLVYQLDPRGSVSGGCSQAITALGYKKGLSPTNPFPAHRSPFFNQNTGQLVFAPSQAGSYVVKVVINELRADTGGNLRNVGNSKVEFMLDIASTCNTPSTRFIATPRDTLLRRQCGDSTLTIITNERFDLNSLEPNATDFTLLTSQNSLVPLQSVELQDDSIFFLTLSDTLSINDTMSLITRKGLDGNTVFNICGKSYKDFDTLATVISSGCKIDTSSGVGLSQWNAEKLSLYPNPAANYVQFKSSVSLVNSRYQLINSEGAVVREAIMQQSKQRIPTAHLSPGVYWIRLEHPDFTTVQKFIKK